MLAIFTLISTLIISTQALDCATANDDTLYIYPSMSNCSKFIVCYRNEEIEMSCLEASLFMFTDERVCLESCHVKMTTARQHKLRDSKASYDYSSDYLLFPSADKPKTTLLCPSRGTTRAAIPHNCNEYIECDDGIGTRQRCADGYEFSPSTYECEEVSVSDCGVNNKLKGSYIPRCRFVKSNLSSFVFPAENCFFFQKCANHMAWPIRCAKSTSFSRATKSCEWSDEVTCGT